MASLVLVGALAANWLSAHLTFFGDPVVGLAAALVFSVTTVGPMTDEPEPTPPSHNGPLCYSGGDARGCPGG